MTSKTDREHILNAARIVLGGVPLKRYSPDTIYKGGRCAQLVRETIEGALGLPANSWEVADKAHEFRKARRGADRWASDYEKAARALGLNKNRDDLRGGDILYWPYIARDGQAYGHTAVYVGEVNGVPCVLENSDWQPVSREAQGALLPLDGLAGKDGRPHVYVTPLKLFGQPSTVVTPTLAIQAAERAPVKPPAPAPAAQGGRVLLSLPGKDWQDVTGARVRVERPQIVVVNATDKDGDVWISVQ